MLQAYSILEIIEDMCKMMEVGGDDVTNKLVAVIHTLPVNNGFQKAVEILLHKVTGLKRARCSSEVDHKIAEDGMSEFWCAL